MKPQMNTDKPSSVQPQPKESHRRDAENAEVPSLGAHASSVPWVSNTSGCVLSQDGIRVHLCSSVVAFCRGLIPGWCNGSTPDFGSGYPGSSPGPGAPRPG